MEILSFILAGGAGSELGVLTSYRAKTAVPFGGRYRIIDFCLSNCVNSGIRDIYVLAQYNPRSLIEHIGMGKPWDLDRKTGGIYILQPSHHGRVAEWYRGTAEALLQNIEIISDSDADVILVLSGDQVYRMDYRMLAEQHVKNSSPITLACRRAPEGDEHRLGMVDIDRAGIIKDFEEKPKHSSYSTASLGIYLFDREFLMDSLARDNIDIVFDIIIPNIDKGLVSSFIFEDYWEDIGSIETYYKASMSLLNNRSFLMKKGFPLFTRESGLAPSRICRGSDVRNSIIADGCRICGEVRDSIIFPGVTVESGAVVEKSIVFQKSRMAGRSRIYRSIVDKEVELCVEASAGVAERDNEDTITVLGKRARVESGAAVEAGGMIKPRTTVTRR